MNFRSTDITNATQFTHCWPGFQITEQYIYLLKTMMRMRMKMTMDTVRPMMRILFTPVLSAPVDSVVLVGDSAAVGVLPFGPTEGKKTCFTI